MNTGTSTSFNILDTVRNGYLFTFRGWSYFGRIMILPLIAQAVCTYITYKTDPALENYLRSFLINLPALAFTAWYLFAGVRYVLLGEKINDLPKSPDALHARNQAMRASVILVLLFNMAATVIMLVLLMLHKKNTGEPPQFSLAAVFLMVFMIWAVRYGVLYIPAAVGFPIRRFLDLAGGFGFSFRLIGLLMMAALPLILIFEIVTRLLFGDVSMEDRTSIILMLAGSIFYLAMLTIINTCCALGLQKMMNASPGRAGRR